MSHTGSFTVAITPAFHHLLLSGITLRPSDETKRDAAGCHQARRVRSIRLVRLRPATVRNHLVRLAESVGQMTNVWRRASVTPLLREAVAAMAAGGWGRQMAEFKIGKVTAGTCQAPETIDNLGAVGSQVFIEARIPGQLRDLLASVEVLTQSGAVDPDSGKQLQALMREAADEAAAPAPERGRLVTTLQRARDLAAGLTATAGIVAAVDSIVGTLTGGQ